MKSKSTRRDRAIAAIQEQIDILQNSYRCPDGKIYDTEIKAQIRDLKTACKMLLYPGYTGYPPPGAIQKYNSALAQAKKESSMTIAQQKLGLLAELGKAAKQGNSARAQDWNLRLLVHARRLLDANHVEDLNRTVNAIRKTVRVKS